MRHRAFTVVALAAALVVTAFAGPAIAATPAADTSFASQQSFPGPRASLQEKKRAYARYCGKLGKRRDAAKARQWRACIDAMARLAVGKASTPAAACRALKHKRSNGRRAAYKRCLKAAKRLQKNQRAAEKKADALEEEADAREEQEVEEANPVPGPSTLDGLLPGPPPDLPDLDDEPVEELDERDDEDI